MLQQQRTHPPWILIPRWLLLGWNWKITICAPIMVLLMIFPHYAECPIGSGQNKVKKINWQGFRWTCCPIWKPDCQPPEKNKKSGKSKGWSVFCPAGGNCKFDLMLLSFLILQKKERIKVQSAKPPILYMSLSAVHMRVMIHPILGTLPNKKNGKMWEFFPSRGPPQFGNFIFVRKNYGLFCILGP